MIRPINTPVFSRHLIFIVLFIAACSKPEVKPVPPPVINPPQPPVNLTGYTDKLSYYPGEPVNLYLSTDNETTNCLLKIYNIHHDSVLHVKIPVRHQGVASNEPWKNGFGYALTSTITLPANMESGVYLIDNKIPLIVKSRQTPDVVVVFPTNTENAYCQSGGKSFYRPVGDKAPIISFLRPIPFPHENKNLNFLENGLQFLRDQKGLSIGYISDMDLDNYNVINSAKLIIIPGHSEYWTLKARRNFDQFIENGNHALILSGNTMWWQVRYSDDRTQLICYKDRPDPISNPLLKTINWVDPSLNYPVMSSIGADFEHGGHGDFGWKGYKIMTPQSPLLDGTGLKLDDILHVPTNEYDGISVVGYQNGYPIPDTSGFLKFEIIGFDQAKYAGQATVACFFALRRNRRSGVIVNMASTNWCSPSGMGGADKNKITRITQNAIRLLVSGGNVFSK